IQIRQTLQGRQRIDQRIEHPQQNQQNIIIEMKLAIAGLVALTSHRVQKRQQRRHLAQPLEVAKLLDEFAIIILGSRHARTMPESTPARKRKNMLFIVDAIKVPNGIGAVPFYSYPFYSQSCPVLFLRDNSDPSRLCAP